MWLWRRSGCQETIHGSGPFSFIEFIYRPSPQRKGWDIVVWAMVLPNGLLSYNFKSPTYIDLICDTIVHICKLSYGYNFWFQQDNSRIHTTKIVKDWMTDSHFPVVEWSARYEKPSYLWTQINEEIL